MRLCASLFRGVAAPLGCVICLQLGDVAVFFTLCAVLSERARWGWYHYPRSVSHGSETLRGRGLKRQTLPLLGLGRGCSRRTQRAFGTAMRLCASLSRGVAAPLSCVICLQLGDVAVFSLCAQYFLNVRGGGAITTLGAFRTFTNIPRPGVRTANFAAFGAWSGVLPKNAESLRDSDALMRVAVPRHRGPAGLRDLFRFCRNCGLYALRSGPFRVCEARGGITTLSALYVLLKRRTAACQNGSFAVF